MAEEQKTKLRLEIAHVLFIDIVGYSKLLLKQQGDLLRELNEMVSATREFREASKLCGFRVTRVSGGCVTHPRCQRSSGSAASK